MGSSPEVYNILTSVSSSTGQSAQATISLDAGTYMICAASGAGGYGSSQNIDISGYTSAVELAYKQVVGRVNAGTATGLCVLMVTMDATGTVRVKTGAPNSSGQSSLVVTVLKA